jgi:hypothetical protein
MVSMTILFAWKSKYSQSCILEFLLFFLQLRLHFSISLTGPFAHSSRSTTSARSSLSGVTQRLSVSDNHGIRLRLSLHGLRLHSRCNSRLSSSSMLLHLVLLMLNLLNRNTSRSLRQNRRQHWSTDLSAATHARLTLWSTNSTLLAWLRHVYESR